MKLLFIALILSICSAKPTLKRDETEEIFDPVAEKGNYSPVFVKDNLEFCKEPTYDDSKFVFTCSKCYDGFTKDEKGKCVLNSNRCTTYPAKGLKSGSECEFYNIGIDSTQNKAYKCTQTIQIVNSFGQTIDDGNLTNQIPQEHINYKCMACAVYGSDPNTCKTCATGYFENGGQCTYVSDSTFYSIDEKIKDDIVETNENCFVGKYQNGDPFCHSCTNDTSYYIDTSSNMGLCKKSKTTDSKDQIEGCVKVSIVDSKFSCDLCRHGYKKIENEQDGFTFGTCKKMKTPLCLSSDDEGNCELCSPGYKVYDGNCAQCSVQRGASFDVSDYCSALSFDDCEKCNANCLRIGESCVNSHCSLRDAKGECIRCEQGYKYLFGGSCEPCETPECIENDFTMECAEGYYLAKRKDNTGTGPTYTCYECPKDCISCLDENTCTKRRNDMGFPKSPNGLPCFDPNCLVCRSDNQKVCLQCSSSSYLIEGRCYTSDKKNTRTEAGGLIGSCQFYSQPDYVYKNEDISNKVDHSYIKTTRVSYEKAANKIGSTIYHYCEYHDELPYYYRYVDGKFQCVGENRDPQNDCECKTGFYPDPNGPTKLSGCTDYNDNKCTEPLSSNVCKKCKEGFIFGISGEGDTAKMICECEPGFRLVKNNGNEICQKCSPQCATCQTENGVEVCLTCNSKVEDFILWEELQSSNFNRNPSDMCNCKEGYVAHDDGKNTVYPCFEVPKTCNNDSSHYKTHPESPILCQKCNDELFVVSQEEEGDAQCQSECIEGYYLKTEGDSITCKRCNGYNEILDFTNCKHCGNDGKCDTCYDTLFTTESDCTACREHDALYVMIKNETHNTPQCHSCHTYCAEPKNGKPRCFFAIKDLASLDGVEIPTDNRYTFTESEFESMEMYCSACGSDNRDPLKQCDCGENSFRDRLDCSPCSEAIDPILCRLPTEQEAKENYDGYLCPVNSETKNIDCQYCKNGFKNRNPKTNCTTCLNETHVPVMNNGNGAEEGCLACPLKCANGCEVVDPSTNEVRCFGCVALNMIDDEEGKCETCAKGYYSVENTYLGYRECFKCDQTCEVCEHDSLNCITCSGNSLHTNSSIVNGETIYRGCQDCESTLIFNYTTRTCQQKSTKDKGFIDSVGVCVKAKKIEVVGETSYSYKVPVRKIEGDERSGVTIVDCPLDGIIENEDEITSFEWALGCDDSNPGLSPNAVDGVCVCKFGYVDNRTLGEVRGDITEVKQQFKPKCIDIRNATAVDFCTNATFDGWQEVIYTYEETEKVLVDGSEDKHEDVIVSKNYTDHYPLYKCTACNADYLELDKETGKCNCKKGYYTTSWGMCIPCDRHFKGCAECKGKKQCTKCKEGSSLTEKEVTVNGKTVIEKVCA